MRSLGLVRTCVVVVVILMLAGGASFAQLMSAPINPEYIQWLNNLGRVPDMTVDGHAFGYIPPPFQVVDPGHAPFGYIPPDWAPTTYDLRNTTNKVPAVRNQGTCGSCWTFATFGSLETCQRPTDTTDFSENNLRAHHGWDYGPCAGGHPWMSMAYMGRWSGPVWESDDGYTATDPVSPTSPSLSPRRHMQEALFLPVMTGPTDLSTIQNAIMNHGAVYMNYYHDNTYYEASTGAFYHPSATTTNHAVCTIGWDNNYASTNFKTGLQPSGNGAWLVRNSWGTGWGNSGYFWVSYYDARYGKSVVAQFRTTEATSNYQHNYDYDPLGNVSALNTPYMANVFTASGNQTVKAVSFYTEAAGANYTVRVYRNPSPVPTGGTPVTTQTGSFTYAGYHTVVLSSPVTIASGNTFSVYVHITSGGSHPAAFEYAVASVTSSATASAGQSYYSFDGSNWVDLTTYNSTANFCVKAFTDNALTPTATGITPNTGPNYGTTSVTSLTGTNFQTGATVTLKKTGQSNIAATGVVVVSPTQITCSLPLTGAATGAWDVVVTNPSTLYGTLSGGFTVTTHTVTASITSITPDPAQLGASVAFTGSGSCTDHSIAAYDWQSNLDGQVGTAASFSTTSLSVGNHTITLRVQCSAGAWSTPVSYSGNPLQIINHTVTAVIDSITPNPVETGQNASFSGHGTDNWPGHSIDQWEWRHSGATVFATTASATYAFGTAGDYTIDFRVHCDGGTWSNWTAWGSNPLQVRDHTVTASVDSITPDPQLVGQNVNFQGSGSCTWPGDTIAAYDWQSSLDGSLGSTATLNLTTLSVGNHTITLRTQCSASRWSTVVSYGGNPLVISAHSVTATIDAITPNPQDFGQGVRFQGHGTCSWGAHTIATHEWKSNVDGTFGTSNDFTYAGLSEGNHTIEYRVQCSGGLWSGWTAWGSNPLTISNVAPSVASVNITPDPAYTTDDLTATPNGWNDVDGDPEGYDWQWDKDTGGGFAVISGANTDTLGNANFIKGDVVRVTCTPNDGEDTGTPVTDQITISNSTPTAPTVAITPASPTANDNLTANASGSTDADGDAVTYSYAWYRNTTLQTSETTMTINSSLTAPSDVWRCVVTPDDGTANGPTGEDTVAIESNVPPTAPTVTITPTRPRSADSITANASGSTDANGDPITYSYAWHLNGTLQPSETTATVLAAATSPGDVWRCVVTPNDGYVDGPTGEDTVTINSPPDAPTLNINPPVPTTNQSFRCTVVGGGDADGDPVTYSYQWHKNGTLQVGVTWQTISSSRTRAGQTWMCEVTANDGFENGPVSQASVTVNAAPSAPTVTITPANPNTNDTLRCNASGSVDPESDPVTYKYQWHKNGVLQPNLTWRTIAASRTRPGQVWRCVVTPTDGLNEGSTGEDTVTVNGTPTAPTVTIAPHDPINHDNLVATATGSTDPDGDPVTYVYRWFKNSVAQPDLTGMRIIRSWRTLPGQVWRVVATPTDGVNVGPSAEDTVTINTRPGPPTVVINPSNPDVTEGLRAQVTACNDPDGDAITYAYQWYRNGVLQPGVIWRSIGAWRTHVGDQWKVVVTPSDLHLEGKPGEATVTILAKGHGVAPLTVTGLAALPTARGAEITFTLSAEGSITCEVLNIAGRAVRTIVADRSMAEGINSLAWDGRNTAGLRAPAGMYLVRMTATAASGARWTSMGTLNLTR